jgi:iron complex transport system substrate-binding protein
LLRSIFDWPERSFLGRRSISRVGVVGADADGDVIFLWTGENSVEDNVRSQQQIDALQRDPLWQRLKAVQAGRVYRVPSYWIGNGPIAANAILDDLFKYLVEPS